MDPINGAAGAQYFGGANKSAEAKAELDVTTFIRLLTVQLANQNPLEPMSDTDFFAQLAQLGQVEGLGKLQDATAMNQAADMIGKEVTAVRPLTESDSGYNSLVDGVVKRATLRNGEMILGIEEANGGIVEVKLENVREIRG